MGFQFVRKISIRRSRVVGGPHTNFPFLFWGFPPGLPGGIDPAADDPATHYYSWLRSVSHGGHVYSESGIDIAFYLDPFGKRLLPFERVTYHPGNGMVEFYIRLPLIVHSDDAPFSDLETHDLYIMYGDPDAVDLSNRTGVWDDTYVGVYHFGDGVTLDVTDSTQYGNHGINHGCIPAQGLLGAPTAGIFTDYPTGGSLGCWGLGYVEIPDSGSLALDDGMTFEYSHLNNPTAYVFPAGGDLINGNILWKYGTLLEGGNGNGFKIRVSNEAQEDLFVEYFQTDFVSVPNIGHGVGNANAIAIEQVSRYDQQFGYRMIQGSTNVSDSPQDWGLHNPAIQRSSLPLLIGGGTNGFGAANHIWPGFIDEVRVSDQPRTDDWLATTSANIGDSLHLFFTVGHQQPTSRSRPRVYVIT